MRRIQHVGRLSRTRSGPLCATSCRAEALFEVFPMSSVMITRIPGLRTVQSFRDYIGKLGIDLQVEDSIIQGSASPLAQSRTWNNRVIGNSWCVQPMEGWD